MDYDVLTFDAQTVQTNSFHFDGGLLAQLKQFKGGQTEIVVAQIVAAEISRHLREGTQQAKEHLESTHKKAQLFGLKKTEDAAFKDGVDVDTLAKVRLQRFFDEIGATIISPDDVPMRDLVKLYVNAAPPFAKSGKKKNEFPDAIALLSLELWAKRTGKHVLAVSGDADWANYAKSSTHRGCRGTF